MTVTPTSTQASVEVAVDPATAFQAFTEEMDLWWVRGPINYFDSARSCGLICEPGVGGRIVEIYEPATRQGLELGRITVWEPGSRIGWTSSVDDIEIEVSFAAVGPERTSVTVEATLPPGGVDRGGTAWVRVVPKWFGRWCDRRLTAPRPQPELARLAVGVYYEKPAAAARWLADVFGFESPDPLPAGPDPLPEGQYGHPWIEFRIGNASLMVFKAEAGPAGPPTHDVWVAVEDLDAHLARAEARGAKIVQPIGQTGFRAYVAEDLEGRRWTIAQARPGQMAS